MLGVPREIVQSLPERLQELLGYNIYGQFVGYVDGRHPRRVLQGLEDPKRTPQQTMASLFEGKTRHEQKALLAELEHGGAALYQALAAGESNPSARDALLLAARREEENAAVVEAQIRSEPPEEGPAHLNR